MSEYLLINNNDELPDYSREQISEKEYFPDSSDLFIPEPSRQTIQFLEKINNSLVNKVVSLTFPDNKPCFDFSIFEMITGKDIQVVVSSSQQRLKALSQDKMPEDFKDFISRTRPIRLNHEGNFSAQILRKAMIDISFGRDAEINIVLLKRDPRIHPKLKKLLTSSMNVAVGVPVFENKNPLGVLWGIRRRPFKDDQESDVRSQMLALHQGISVVLSEELFGDMDVYSAKRKVEKMDCTAKIQSVYYTRFNRQASPVKSLMAYSTRYKKYYRQDTSFHIPTKNGFSISLKRFLPRETNEEKVILLMIPGFFCNRSLMDRLAKEMSLKYGYMTFTMDLRGRSKYTLPPKNTSEKFDWTIDDYIWEDYPMALHWINETHPGYKIVPLGHSMGGMIPRFYNSCYEYGSILRDVNNLPYPDDLIPGIISITSPNYINLDVNSNTFYMAVNSVKLAGKNFLGEFSMKLLSSFMTNTIGTVDLHRFFKFLHNATSSMRMFSYNISSNVPTVKDFVGYPQITPPEWYFLMEDVFCEESVKVIIQFVRSQLSDQAFLSFDQKINYTEEAVQLKTPLMSIVGTLDTLAPPDTVLHAQDLAQSDKNRSYSFEQGHLGIVTHPPTVAEIARLGDEWIRNL